MSNFCVVRLQWYIGIMGIQWIIKKGYNTDSMHEHKFTQKKKNLFFQQMQVIGDLAVFPTYYHLLV